MFMEDDIHLNYYYYKMKKIKINNPQVHLSKSP